jgi:ComF family protein
MTPTLLNDLLHLFFPPLCELCGIRLVKGEEQLCLYCIGKLSYTCYSGLTKNLVYERIFGHCAVQHTVAFLFYTKESLEQQLVHRIKYGGGKDLAYYMGRLMARKICLKDNFSDAELLMPVPLLPQHLKKRGYNQSERLCQGISAIWQLPVSTQLQRRKSKDSTQTKKAWYERWSDQAAIFAVENAETLQGKHIILVDDVFTSGSTLTACAKPLLLIPGVRVSILTLTVTYS